MSSGHAGRGRRGARDLDIVTIRDRRSLSWLPEERRPGGDEGGERGGRGVLLPNLSRRNLSRAGSGGSSGGGDRVGVAHRPTFFGTY